MTTLVPLLLALPLLQEAAPASAPAPPDPALLALFDYDRAADLEVEERAVHALGGCEKVDLTYASPAGGRVPAYLFTPEGDGPFAGVLLMHGMPGSREGSDTLARLYVDAGAVVLAISAPWARPDGPRADVLRFDERDRAEQIQLIQDLRRGVDLLVSLPWVDPERLGYVGGSYGGAMGGLLAGVETRIRAYALMVGDGGLVAHFTSPGEKVPPEGVTSEAWAAWVAAMEPLEPLRWVRHAAPAELLFQNGRTDQLVPAADAEDYHRAASEPKTVMWYDGGHGIDRRRLEDQLAWMTPRLGLARDATD